MRIQDLRGTTPSTADLLDLLPRPVTDVAVALDVARELVEDVRTRGSAALLDQAERLDRVRPESLRVPAEAIAAAVDDLDASVRAALEEAIRRVRLGSAAQVPPETTTTVVPGGTIVQRWQPVRRVGLYVPGGKAVYPSSVVMNVVAAQVAGVASIALASPAQAAYGGSVHPVILGAAGLLGVDEVYAMGGAGAIGAFAHGVPDLGLEPVDVVTGPGNIYVAAAKRVVRGVTGIDSEAGTTEILVIADAHADPRLVAADLVSQAEHDEMAASVLVTDSPELARAVDAEVEALAATTGHSARVGQALTGPQSAILVVDDLVTAARYSDAYGPEHLSVQIADPDALLAHLHSAGAIFLGPHSPVSLGDYLAGSNHVLPTGGQARFGSGLGAYTFLRPQQVVRYDADALREAEPMIVALSRAEDLPAHGDAVTARLTP
ncbi:histidinol dehydrogenase [Clavibacter michiganensis]|uniref:histidinol dehydrogenase n=1 Tax=Clavibacter michiganensis TaxID=28447 RepID=UPI001D0B7500|nr:histidinol dehydrogenase [Clavibacter michiganensis]MDO4043117.1 histidinol dehydrogenase [Clavibacter michiganensis]MDO4052629.1 histidinol dehydrogenase [Clavibacter michiganensis]MDO4055328.1 histidinol dehydrogenase [Clavibacter michiganensis]MDO4068801.1 histidinol dehydrogenase [Clavibacter michiganensis]UDM15279.1 histidinol dehydrogenase [Clavibacter michiganensis subsp. michiganensis]